MENLSKEKPSESFTSEKIKEIETISTSFLLSTPKNNLKRCQPSTSESQQKSPAKKLRLDPAIIKSIPDKKPKNQFIYGNYNRYYNYRHPCQEDDIRLIAFRSHLHLFTGKIILDIGCNDGAVTTAIAQNFGAKFITGIDIDRNLINRAKKNLLTIQKSITVNNNKQSIEKLFPFNIQFDQCNYVLSDDVLVEMEVEKFDVILCLSVTKWIHLNFGDAGLKRAFKRMFKQLKFGGYLILEAQQNWKSYKRRKNLSIEIKNNFQNIKLYPNKFDEYLLSDEIGFTKCSEIALSEHSIKGFQRPIKVFYKTALNGNQQQENENIVSIPMGQN